MGYNFRRRWLNWWKSLGVVKFVKISWRNFKRGLGSQIKSVRSNASYEVSIKEMIVQAEKSLIKVIFKCFIKSEG